MSWLPTATMAPVTLCSSRTVSRKRSLHEHARRFRPVEQRGDAPAPLTRRPGTGAYCCRLYADQRGVQLKRLGRQHLRQARLAARLHAPEGDDVRQLARGVGVEFDDAQGQEKLLQRHAVLLRAAADLGARLQRGHRQRGDGHLVRAVFRKRGQQMARSRTNQVQAIGCVEEKFHAAGRCGKRPAMRRPMRYSSAVSTKRATPAASGELPAPARVATVALVEPA